MHVRHNIRLFARFLEGEKTDPIQNGRKKKYVKINQMKLNVLISQRNKCE